MWLLSCTRSCGARVQVQGLQQGAQVAAEATQRSESLSRQLSQIQVCCMG